MSTSASERDQGLDGEVGPPVEPTAVAVPTAVSASEPVSASGPVDSSVQTGRAPPLLNVANLLTLLRLALVPVFLECLLRHGGLEVGWRLAATGIFAVAALTDRFDGDIARRRGLVTRFGMIADPIADKTLIGCALVGLSLLGQLAWWVTIVIAVRELAVTALRFWVLRFGVLAASRGGKLKTLVQTLAIGLFVFPLPALLSGSTPGAILLGLRWSLLAVALLLTVGTGIDYVVRALRLRARRSPAAEAAPGPS